MQCNSRCHSTLPCTMQAERMVKRGNRIFAPVQVGCNVTKPIPHVDRARTDLRNIIGVVTECSDNGMYNIVVKGDTLSGKYSHHKIEVCATKLYSANDFNTNKPVSLRQAVQPESTVVGRALPRATVQVPGVVKLIVAGVSRPRCSATLGVTQHCRVQTLISAIHFYRNVNTKQQLYIPICIMLK